MKSSKNIFAVFIVFYFILGVRSLIRKELIAADFFIATGFCIAFLLVNRKYTIRPLIAVFAGLIFFPHILGDLGLYKLATLNYHYDWIVHFLSPIFSTIAIVYFLLDNKLTKKFISAAVIAISISITFGALIEMSEYWGFRTIGLGEGYLGFGVADDSQNYGPWENSSWDTSINFLGSLFAILVLWFKDKFVKKKR